MNENVTDLFLFVLFNGCYRFININVNNVRFQTVYLDPMLHLYFRDWKWPSY